MPPRATFVLVVVAIATLLVFFNREQLQQLSQGQLTSLSMALLALILVGGYFFGIRGAQYRQNLARNAFLWILIFLGLTMTLSLLPPEMMDKYKDTGW
jgi:hypothetical protein